MFLFEIAMILFDLEISSSVTHWEITENRFKFGTVDHALGVRFLSIHPDWSPFWIFPGEYEFVIL